MATNRHDTLDPALLRPGRLDRKIEFPMPDRRQKRLIFSTITSKMNLSDEVCAHDMNQMHNNTLHVHLHAMVFRLIWRITLLDLIRSVAQMLTAFVRKCVCFI